MTLASMGRESQIHVSGKAIIMPVIAGSAQLAGHRLSPQAV